MDEVLQEADVVRISHVFSILLALFYYLISLMFTFLFVDHTDKPTSNIGQNNLSSHQQRKAFKDEEGMFIV